MAKSESNDSSTCKGHGINWIEERTGGFAMGSIRRNKTNSLIKSIPPSGIRRFFDLVAEMKDVISLGVGEPDFPTPEHIRKAGIESIQKGITSYTSNSGLLQLRQEIVKDAKHYWDLDYDPKNEALVTVGASEAIDLALRAILEPGDEVLYQEPVYVSYAPTVKMAGGVPVAVTTYAEHQFKMQPDHLRAKITPRSKVLMLNYPNNPTGGVMDRATLTEIAKICEEHDLIVISDEIYAHLTYSGKHVCFASLPGMRERTVLLNGFSKAYAMTGWRLGYALGDEEIIKAMTKIHQFTILCCSTNAQYAAIEALRNGETAMLEMKKSYDERRKFFVAGLNRIGLTCFEPLGAFYAFPSIKISGMDSNTFAEELLREEKVAVTPGGAFGECGEGYVRCSLASSMENLKESLVRMERFLERHKKQVG